MKYLKLYKQLNLKSEKNVFDYFLNNLNRSIFGWDYFVDFVKVKENINQIETELNILNVLIGKKNLIKEFKELLKKYPNIRKALLILIAVRKQKIKNTDILDEDLVLRNKYYLFDTRKPLTKKIINELAIFFTNSGLKDIFEDKNIKNIVDYVFGVEVGMDTNARKNRTGQYMESIIESIIKKYVKKYDQKYLAQANEKKIKKAWNIDIKVDKTDRIFDFVILTKQNKLYVIETNYYSGTGSKVKSTAGEYKKLYDFLKAQNITFIWITDGLGWLSTKNALEETFLYIDYLLNLDLIKKGVLKEVIR